MCVIFTFTTLNKIKKKQRKFKKHVEKCIKTRD